VKAKAQRKYRPARRAGQWCWIYDGRDAIAEIHQQADGRWRVIMMRGDRDAGTFRSRELAIAAAHEAAERGAA
jgi:hypothetical protein